MWKEYGQGVAIVSGYGLLKSQLNAIGDRAYIGMVRYGVTHLIGERANIFKYITTKRKEYADEQEVRALLWIMDPHAGINRHIGEDNRVHPLPLTPPPPHVLKGHRRKVNLQTLVTRVIMSPWATSETYDEISQLVKQLCYGIPVELSELSRYKVYFLSCEMRRNQWSTRGTRFLFLKWGLNHRPLMSVVLRCVISSSLLLPRAPSSCAHPLHTL